MNTVRLFLTALLVVYLCMSAPAGAELIQHLDASVPESIVMLGDQVQQWKDLSGNDNHAIGNRGSVLYPSTPLAGGYVGLDFGFERNDLELFNEAETSALLDFSDAAAGNSGFTVFVACRVDMIDPANDQYILGTKNTNGNFMLWIDKDDGQLKAKVNNNTNSSGELFAAAGDTLVLGIGYEAATGNIWFYESKNDVVTTATKPANGNWDAGEPLVLGEAKPTINSSNHFRGAIGEVMVFNEYIDFAAAQQYMTELVYKWVTPLAEKLKPGALVPQDGVDEQPVEGLTLSWIAGQGSVNQVVYFGTDAEVVANTTPDSPEYMGTQTGTSYALPTLDYATTYYYRIESISDATYSSDVTAFTTELYAYPLDADYITVSASSTVGALDPNDTVNGAGMDVNDMHTTGFNAMWLSDPNVQGPVWIQYDFDAAVKLNEILIWNHNSEVEEYFGLGIQNATIEYTTDGLSWQSLTEVTLVQAPGAAEYEANNSIPVNDLIVEGVRINALNGFEGLVPNMYGLSEVRFLVVPLQAADPVPTNSQMILTLDPTLSWKAGRGAVSHELYFNTDEAAVVYETVAPITLMETSYELTALDINTVYYWKVNENTGSEIWAGNVWNFTTSTSVLLDDMEEYTADVPNPIYAAWVDGYEEPQSNGSLVGADPYAGDGDPFTPGDGDYSPEIVVIRSGLQSLPIWFDNNVAPVSTVTRTFTNTDIPDVGAKGMVLYYRFGTDSVGDELFVEINGVEVASVTIPATIIPVWNEISIDLATAGVDDAAQITSMTIGIRSADAKGVVYVDDILLTN